MHGTSRARQASPVGFYLCDLLVIDDEVTVLFPRSESWCCLLLGGLAHSC